MAHPESVTITDVALRDGLQNHPRTVPTVTKLVLLDRLPWVALLILVRDVLLVTGYRFVVPRGYDFEVSRTKGMDVRFQMKGDKLVVQPVS